MKENGNSLGRDSGSFDREYQLFGGRESSSSRGFASSNSQHSAHYLNDLAQFGIYPSSSSSSFGSSLNNGFSSSTGGFYSGNSSGNGNFRRPPGLGGSSNIPISSGSSSRMGVSPSMGSPISASNGFDISPNYISSNSSKLHGSVNENW